MKIKVLIVEDEVLVADDISSSLQADGYEVTAIAISAEECMAAIAANPPHVILMDIHIKGAQDGIETAKQVGGIPVIFITSNTGSKFVSRALEVFPHAFISKPYHYTDVTAAIDLAFNRNNERLLRADTGRVVPEAVFVKKGEYYQRILVDQIHYIEASGSYCEVTTATEKFVLSFNLNHFQSTLNHPSFKRIHRSYVVNLKRVEKFDHAGVWVGNTYLPVSTTYKQELVDFFKKMP